MIDHPDSDAYSDIYTVEACIRRDCTRDDVKLISERIIESLPKHNNVLIFFVSDLSEKDKGWTVARTYWGPLQSVHDDKLLEAGDYTANVMKIALKGEDLPGVTIQEF